MRKYFVSYGDHHYKQSKQRLTKEAKELDYFDSIQVFGREQLDESFVFKTSPYINAPRGGGYWLWKPFL